MVSLAWSICAQPTPLFVTPSPRSYASTLQNEVHSPIRRRWAECWEFAVQMPDAERFSPPQAIFEAHERAVPIRAHHTSLLPPTNYQKSPTALRSTSQPTAHARRPGRTAAIDCATGISIKHLFSTLNASSIELPSTPLYIYYKTLYNKKFPILVLILTNSRVLTRR